MRLLPALLDLTNKETRSAVTGRDAGTQIKSFEKKRNSAETP